MQCHACFAKNADPSEFTHSFVSSDCKPVHAALELFQCDQCGLVQKHISQVWLNSCEQIYAAYEIYHQAGGEEQAVKPVSGGPLVRRSSLLVDLITHQYAKSDSPAVLDIGCGNGALLRAWNDAKPEAHLYGAELNRDFASDIEAISSQTNFMTLDELASTDVQFDVVSLVHCLEHIPGPIQYLEGLCRLLKPEGILFIQVPDAHVNPFDLLIADHASHFSNESLGQVVANAGFVVDQIGNLLLGKEISAIAFPATGGSAKLHRSKLANPQSLKHGVAWLGEALDLGHKVSSNDKFGIFGTSIAATWFIEELKGQVAFLVDEDPQRIGRNSGGIEIVGPHNIPQGASVLYAVEPVLGHQIAARHQDKNFNAYLMPGNTSSGEVDR